MHDTPEPWRIAPTRPHRCLRLTIRGAAILSRLGKKGATRHVPGVTAAPVRQAATPVPMGQETPVPPSPQ